MPQMGPQGMPMPQGQPPMAPQMPQMGQPQPEGQERQGPPQYEPVPQDLEERLTPEQAAQLKAITRVFDLTTGKYDVMIDSGPGFATRREEAATQMMEFIRIFPQAAPLIGDLLAKNLDWPGAEQVAERLQAMLPPQAQGQINSAVQQLQQMLQTQDGQAKQAIAQLQQQLQKFSLQMENKAGELRIKTYEAETNRIEALAVALKDGVTLTRDAMGNMQAIPLEKPPEQPTVDTLIESQLRQRDQALKQEDLNLKATKIASDHNVAHAQAFTQHMQAVHGMSVQDEAPGAVESEPMQGPGMDGSQMHEAPEGEPAEPNDNSGMMGGA
jgi:hypothetical protein